MNEPLAPFEPPQPPALPPAAPPLPGGEEGEDYLGWIGVVCGAITWLSCCCTVVPFLGVIGNLGGLLFATAAVVLGGMSVYRARQRGRSVTVGVIALSLGGVRLGLIALLLAVVGLLLALGLGGGLLAALDQGHF